MWNEEALNYFKALSQSFQGGTEYIDAEGEGE
jgi:hypothetical protein